MAILDDLFSALQAGQTPWAQEALRRMQSGEDLGNIDVALAEKVKQQTPARVAPPSARSVAPPAAPESSADPFRGPAKVVSRISDIDAAAVPEAPGGISAISAPPAPAPQAPAQAPAQAAPAQWMKPAPAEPAPDLSGPNPIAKALGLDRLGIGAGNDKERMRKLTYDEVLARTGSKANAELAARDPRIFMAMLPTLTAKKDEWKMEKVGEDENGRATYAWTNSRTREMRPVTQGGLPTIQGTSVASQAAPAAAPASVAAPAPTAAPNAPASIVPGSPPPGVNPIEWRKEAAKKAADDSAAQAAKKRDQERVAKQFSGGLEQLSKFPNEFGKDAFERAIGPWSATDPNPDNASGMFGTGLSVGTAGRYIARGMAELDKAVTGGASPTEVRDRMETTTKNLAAVMKPLVRGPGEGAWSDKDQANLEAQLGQLTRANSVDEYNRRLADIRENIGKIFLIETPEPRAQERSANAPAPAVSKDLMKQLGPDLAGEILKKVLGQ